MELILTPHVNTPNGFTLDFYLKQGGYGALKKALGMTPDEVIDVVKASGLRGRGGAGFPTGIKWRTVLNEASETKYIVCNADEGDSGTFADRMLMEGDPFCLIEGMTIAAYAVGATEGYVYLRSEYPDAVATLKAAIEIARGRGRSTLTVATAAADIGNLRFDGQVEIEGTGHRPFSDGGDSGALGIASLAFEAVRRGAVTG